MDILTFVKGQWDLVGAWALVVAGAVTLLIGWFGVSRTPFPAEQIPYVLSAGVGGLFLLGTGAVLWLSADLRDEWRKLDAIEELLRHGTEEEDVVLVPLASARTTPRRRIEGE